MDEPRTRAARGLQNPIDQEIALLRARLADDDRLIGLRDMRGPGVRFGVDRDRL
jgi:hypothetical protein